MNDFPWWQDGFVYMPIALLLIGGIVVLIAAWLGWPRNE